MRRAGRLLRLYAAGGRVRPRPPGEPRPPAPAHGPFLRGLVSAACFLFAAGLLSVGLVGGLACRPDLTGHRLRARQVTPADVRRIWAGILPASLILRRLRV